MKKKGKVAYLTLTPSQLAAIEPIKEIARREARKGEPGMILAQIIGGTARVGFMPHKRAAHIIDAAGGDSEKRVSSIEDCRNDNVIARG